MTIQAEPESLVTKAAIERTTGKHRLFTMSSNIGLPGCSSYPLISGARRPLSSTSEEVTTNAETTRWRELEEGRRCRETHVPFVSRVALLISMLSDFSNVVVKNPSPRQGVDRER